MTGNRSFYTPEPTLEVLQTTLNTFTAAVTQTVGGNKQDTADIKPKRVLLEDDLRIMADYVHRISFWVEVTILC